MQIYAAEVFFLKGGYLFQYYAKREAQVSNHLFINYDKKNKSVLRWKYLKTSENRGYSIISPQRKRIRKEKKNEN